MACRCCIVGFGNLNSCEVTQASSPWPGTSGWSNYRAPEPGFSSGSLTGCLTASTIPKVTVNPSLLVPLDLKVDPAIQQQKSQKKEEMKVLNDKFASLIGKVSKRCGGALSKLSPGQVAELCISQASRLTPAPSQWEAGTANSAG